MFWPSPPGAAFKMRFALRNDRCIDPSSSITRNRRGAAFRGPLPPVLFHARCSPSGPHLSRGSLDRVTNRQTCHPTRRGLAFGASPLWHRKDRCSHFQVADTLRPGNPECNAPPSGLWYNQHPLERVILAITPRLHHSRSHPASSTRTSTN